MAEQLAQAKDKLHYADIQLTESSTPGLCPGPTEIQCCTTSSGGGSGCGAPNVNAATVSLIKEFEGYRASPYDDPTGHETVGYGHLCTRSGCTEVPYSFPLTAANGVKLLQSDLSVCPQIRNGLQWKLTQRPDLQKVHHRRH